jgi:hypothetical protein
MFLGYIIILKNIYLNPKKIRVIITQETLIVIKQI